MTLHTILGTPRGQNEILDEFFDAVATQFGWERLGQVLELVQVMEAGRDADTAAFFRSDLYEVPQPGEHVMLQGYPFIVIERAWAIERPCTKDGEALHRQFAFVRVVKYGEFEIED